MELRVVAIMTCLATDGAGWGAANLWALTLDLTEPFNQAGILPLQTVDPRKSARHVIAHASEGHVGLGPVVRHLRSEPIKLGAGDWSVPERHLCFG